MKRFCCLRRTLSTTYVRNVMACMSYHSKAKRIAASYLRRLCYGLRGVSNDSDNSQYSHQLITCAFNNFPPPSTPQKILFLTLKRWTDANEVTTEVEPYPSAEF